MTADAVPFDDPLGIFFGVQDILIASYIVGDGIGCAGFTFIKLTNDRCCRDMAVVADQLVMGRAKDREIVLPHRMTAGAELRVLGNPCSHDHGGRAQHYADDDDDGITQN